MEKRFAGNCVVIFTLFSETSMQKNTGFNQKLRAIA